MGRIVNPTPSLAPSPNPLLGKSITLLERAALIAERKRFYEDLHPDTKRGVAGAQARWRGARKPSYAAELARELGVSVREVHRAIRRHQRIAPDVRALLWRTTAANVGVELDALSKLPWPQQRVVVGAVVAGSFQTVRSAIAVMKGDA